MLLNLAPLSRGGWIRGRDIRQDAPRHRFGKTCATAQAWRKDDYDVVFSLLTLALVITHIAKSKKQPISVKLLETDQIEQLRGKGAKKCYIDEIY